MQIQLYESIAYDQISINSVSCAEIYVNAHTEATNHLPYDNRHNCFISFMPTYPLTCSGARLNACKCYYG